MIVNQDGLSFECDRDELLAFLDLAAKGQIVSLDTLGAVELDTFCGDVSNISPVKAGLYAQAIRAELVHGIAPEDDVATEEFARRVVEACEEDALAERYEASFKAA